MPKDLNPTPAGLALILLVKTIPRGARDGIAESITLLAKLVDLTPETLLGDFRVHKLPFEKGKPTHWDQKLASQRPYRVISKLHGTEDLTLVDAAKLCQINASSLKRYVSRNRHYSRHTTDEASGLVDSITVLKVDAEGKPLFTEAEAIETKRLWANAKRSST